MEKVKARWKKIHQAYGAFIEKQGFFVVLAVVRGGDRRNGGVERRPKRHSAGAYLACG